MIKLDLSPNALAHTTNSDVTAKLTQRLIVLVPADSNYGASLQRIWELATATGRCIRLLGLSKDTTQELSLRRQLITMSALLSDSKVPTEAKIEFGTKWIEAVRKNYQVGDIIVCFAEQRDGLLQKPLNQILEENFDAPIFILSGLYPLPSSNPKVLSLLTLWAGFIGIIGGAFLLQTRIMALPRDWSQITLLLLSTAAEFSLIWVWNNFFS